MKTFKVPVSTLGLTKALTPKANSGEASKCLDFRPDKNGLMLDPTVFSSIEGLVCEFPYPQFLVLSDVTLVCTATDIYEYKNVTRPDVLYKVYTTPYPARTWSVADFGIYILLTNGYDVVRKDPDTKEYTALTVEEQKKIPICDCWTNFNGQIVAGGIEDTWHSTIVEGIYVPDLAKMEVEDLYSEILNEVSKVTTPLLSQEVVVNTTSFTYNTPPIQGADNVTVLLPSKPAEVDSLITASVPAGHTIQYFYKGFGIAGSIYVPTILNRVSDGATVYGLYSHNINTGVTSFYVMSDKIPYPANPVIVARRFVDNILTLDMRSALYGITNQAGTFYATSYPTWNGIAWVKETWQDDLTSYYNAFKQISFTAIGTNEIVLQPTENCVFCGLLLYDSDPLAANYSSTASVDCHVFNYDPVRRYGAFIGDITLTYTVHDFGSGNRQFHLTQTSNIKLTGGQEYFVVYGPSSGSTWSGSFTTVNAKFYGIPHQGILEARPLAILPRLVSPGVYDIPWDVYISSTMWSNVESYRAEIWGFPMAQYIDSGGPEYVYTGAPGVDKPPYRSKADLDALYVKLCDNFDGTFVYTGKDMWAFRLVVYFEQTDNNGIHFSNQWNSYCHIKEFSLVAGNKATSSVQFTKNVVSGTLTAQLLPDDYLYDSNDPVHGYSEVIECLDYFQDSPELTFYSKTVADAYGTTAKWSFVQPNLNTLEASAGLPDHGINCSNFFRKGIELFFLHRNPSNSANLTSLWKLDIVTGAKTNLVTLDFVPTNCCLCYISGKFYILGGLTRGGNVNTSVFVIAEGTWISTVFDTISESAAGRISTKSFAYGSVIYTVDKFNSAIPLIRIN